LESAVQHCDLGIADLIEVHSAFQAERLVRRQIIQNDRLVAVELTDAGWQLLQWEMHCIRDMRLIVCRQVAHINRQDRA
jgi:hypothetical protein